MTAQLLALLLSFLLSSCGVTAGNPGDGKPQRFTVTGVVRTLENDERRVAEVSLRDPEDAVVFSTNSATDGTYAFEAVTSGTYELVSGSAFRQTIQVFGPTIINIILAVPAAVTDYRFVDMGPFAFCLLWRDNSGLEAGYHVQGPQTHDLPAERIGFIERFYNNPVTRGIDGREYAAFPTNAAMYARSWNERYAGSYAITAFNEYGEAASATVAVPAYPEIKWALTPPEDPRFIDAPTPDQLACLDSFPKVYGEPNFIEP